jgi:hypothetical protein
MVREMVRQRIAALAVFFVVAHVGAAQAQDAPDLPTKRSDPRPHHGVTDTTHVERGAITLREIISRAIEGEKSKLEGRTSLSYTMTVRSIVLWENKRKIVNDVLVLAYNESSGFSRFVEVNNVTRQFDRKESSWVENPDEVEESAAVRVESDGHSDFTELPFFLEEIEEFHFELRSRTVEVDHVIFEIGFKPKSDFKPLPSGTIFIDTTDYRIIHEEFHFEKNPFPLLLKGIRHVSRHWDRLPTGEWVFTRVLAEIEMRGFMPYVPDRIQLSLERRDFAFDKPYSAHLFGER